MQIDQPAVVAVKRSRGCVGVLQPLRVFIDGQHSGGIFRGTREFPVTAGKHVVSVSLATRQSAPACVDVRAGERIELCCTSDPEPLHPWHVHGVLFLLVFSVLHTLVGLFVPQVRKFAEQNLMIELLLALAFSTVGMSIYFYRVAKKGTWHPSLCLTAVPGAEEPGT
jgi:hypothetical protein